jgi:hypothetical protein
LRFRPAIRPDPAPGPKLGNGDQPKTAPAQGVNDAGQRPYGLLAWAPSVVHEDDRAVARLPQHGGGDAIGAGQRPVAGIDVPLHGDEILRAGVAQQGGGDVAERRSEEARDVAGRAFDRALGLVDLHLCGYAVAGQVGMGEGVVADRVAVSQHAPGRSQDAA